MNKHSESLRNNKKDPVTNRKSESSPDLCLKHPEGVKRLSVAGITYSSSGSCFDKYYPSCISFDGVRANTISQVISLKQISRCPINITGGTEIGHAPGIHSHRHGYKLDLTLNSCLDDFIKGNFVKSSERYSDGASLYKCPQGNVYCRQQDHWDVLYYPQDSSP